MGDSGDFIESEKPDKCQSCKKDINTGDLCISIERYRYPNDELEAKNTGYDDLEEAMENEATIKMDDHYICEKCGEIFLNLQNVGFECLSPSENMPDALREYQIEYAPPKLNLKKD